MLKLKRTFPKIFWICLCCSKQFFWIFFFMLLRFILSVPVIEKELILCFFLWHKLLKLFLCMQNDFPFVFDHIYQTKYQSIHCSDRVNQICYLLLEPDARACRFCDNLHINLLLHTKWLIGAENGLLAFYFSRLSWPMNPKKLLSTVSSLRSCIILLSLFSIIIFCFVFADITGKGVSHLFPCIKIAKQKTAFLKKIFFINQQLTRISMLNIVFLQRKCLVEFDLAIFYMQCS